MIIRREPTAFYFLSRTKRPERGGSGTHEHMAQPLMSGTTYDGVCVCVCLSHMRSIDRALLSYTDAAGRPAHAHAARHGWLGLGSFFFVPGFVLFCFFCLPAQGSPRFRGHMMRWGGNGMRCDAHQLALCSFVPSSPRLGAPFISLSLSPPPLRVSISAHAQRPAARARAAIYQTFPSRIPSSPRLRRNPTLTPRRTRFFVAPHRTDPGPRAC